MGKKENSGDECVRIHLSIYGKNTKKAIPFIELVKEYTNRAELQKVLMQIYFVSSKILIKISYQ